MPGIFCLSRDTHQGMCGAGKRSLVLRCADEWRGRRLRDRGPSRSAAHTRGAGHKGRGRGGELASRGAVTVASPIQLQKIEAAPPRPFVHLRHRLAVREAVETAGRSCTVSSKLARAGTVDVARTCHTVFASHRKLAVCLGFGVVPLPLRCSINPACR